MHRGRPGSQELRRDPSDRIDGFIAREEPVNPCVINEFGGGFTGSTDGGIVPAVGHPDCFT